MALDAEIYPAYYDGSGKKDTDAISLAGAAHFEQAWGDCEVDWGKTLERHGVKCFHMCDAIALQREFLREKGWDEILISTLPPALSRR